MDDVKKEMNPIEYDWTTMGDGRKHRDPVEEMMFYQAVASGAIGQVQDNCSRRVFEETECMGILSDDPGTESEISFRGHNGDDYPILLGWRYAPRGGIWTQRLLHPTHGSLQKHS